MPRHGSPVSRRDWLVLFSSAAATLGISRVARADGGGEDKCAGGLGPLVDVKSFGGDPTNVADYSPALQKAVNTTAGSGDVLYLSAGTYRLGSPVVMASDLMIVGTPKTTLQQTFPFTGDPTNAGLVFQQTTGGATTLSQPTTIGGNTILVDSLPGGLAAGGVVQLRALAFGGLRSALYVVQSISGNGPFALQLDRPVLYAFDDGDPVTQVLSRGERIVILGNKMRMTGTGDRYIELSAGYRCTIQDVIIDTSEGGVGDYAVSLDVGSYECTLRRITLDGGGVIPDGIALESSEACEIESCVSANVTSKAFPLLDSVQCSIKESKGHDSLYGLYVGGEYPSAGCSSINVRGCEFYGNDVGINIGRSSDRTLLLATSAHHNKNYGVIITGVGGTPQTQVLGGSMTSNGKGGVLVQGGSRQTIIDSVDVSNNAETGLNVQAECIVRSLTSQAGNADGAIYTGEGTGSGYSVEVSDLTIQSSAPYWNALVINNLCTARVAHAAVTIDGSDGKGFVCVDGSKLITRDVAVGGSGAGTVAVKVAAGATYRQQGSLQSQTTVAVISEGYYSRGTLDFGQGNASVDVPFPDLQSTDMVVLTRTITAGQVTAPPQVALTPGEKFTVTCLDGDQSVYAYEIR